MMGFQRKGRLKGGLQSTKRSLAFLPEKGRAGDDGVVLDPTARQVIFLFGMNIFSLELDPIRQFISCEADSRPNILLEVRVVNCSIKAQFTDTPAAAEGQTVKECVAGLAIPAAGRTGSTICRNSIPEKPRCS